MQLEGRTAYLGNPNKLSHSVTVPFQVRIPNCRLLSPRIYWPESPLSPSKLQSCLCRTNGSTFQDIIVWDMGTEGICMVGQPKGRSDYLSTFLWVRPMLWVMVVLGIGGGEKNDCLL